MKRLVLMAVFAILSPLALDAATFVNQTGRIVYARWGYNKLDNKCYGPQFAIQAGQSIEIPTPPCYAETLLLNYTEPQGPFSYSWAYTINSAGPHVITVGKDKMYQPIFILNGIAGVKP